MNVSSGTFVAALLSSLLCLRDSMLFSSLFCLPDLILGRAAEHANWVPMWDTGEKLIDS
jgi:hypothetical protein